MPRDYTPRTGRVTWPEVVKVINLDPKTDSTSLGPLSAAGFTPDNFDRLRNSREAVANLLTRGEDELEPLAGARREAKRLAIRGVRRRLEWELWP